MKLTKFAIPVLAFGLAASGSLLAQNYGPPQGPPPGYGGQGPGGGWDMPPQEFRDIQRKGFHDGIEGARKDFDHHRRPDVNNRSEFRHPHVPPSAREDYRVGFQRGYDTAMHHMMEGPGGPGPR